MYTHVSKYKKDKILKKLERKHRHQNKLDITINKCCKCDLLKHHMQLLGNDAGEQNRRIKYVNSKNRNGLHQM
jgi:hypothetical protein